MQIKVCARDNASAARAVRSARGMYMSASGGRLPFSQQDAQVSFVAQVTGNSSIVLEDRSTFGGDLKLGPSGGVGFVPFSCLSP